MFYDWFLNWFLCLDSFKYAVYFLSNPSMCGFSADNFRRILHMDVPLLFIFFLLPRIHIVSSANNVRGDRLIVPRLIACMCLQTCIWTLVDNGKNLIDFCLVADRAEASIYLNNGVKL